MVNGLLGRKLGMTRVFTEDGRWIHVTLVEAGPCTVIQKKTQDSDGYDAIQVGFGEARESRLNKPQLGHFKKAGQAPKQVLREFRSDAELNVGDEIRNDIFKAGDRVTSARARRGFATQSSGTAWAAAPRARLHFHRAPGPIGQSADPSKVYKGKRLPGRMVTTTDDPEHRNRGRR